MRTKLTIIVSASVISCVQVPSIAQAQQSTTEPTTIEEIVVTADRREQSLQSVPISVSALTAQTIERAQIHDLQDYAVLIPNFKAIDLGTPGRSNISIRGVSNIGGQSSSIAIYYDEFGVSTSDGSGFDLDLDDIERIEVLRGPQGTLFGRNSIGGAVNVITRKPADRFDARFSTELSSYDTQLIQGMLNVPLVPGTLFARGTLSYGRSGGYIRDIGPANNSDRYDRLSGRGALRLRTGPLTVDFAVAASRDDQGVETGVPTGVLAPAVLGVGIVTPITGGEGFFPSNIRTIATDLPVFNKRRSTTVSAHITYDFTTMRAVLIAGTQETSVAKRDDLDRTPIPYTFVDKNNIDNRLYGIEARLESTNKTGFNWLIGGAYNIDRSRTQFVGGFLADFLAIFRLPASLAPFYASRQDTLTKSSSLAGFGRMGWTSNDDKLAVAISARYTSDRLSIERSDTSQLFPTGNAANIRFDAQKTYSDVTPKLTLTYTPNRDVTLYGSLSRGYKSGGFNAAAALIPSAPIAYGKETANNYEIGVKTSLFDRRLRLNGSLYRTDWKNIQVLSSYQSPSLIFYNFTQNATSATLTGFEIEAEAILSTGLTINASLGYNDSKFNDFTTAINKSGQQFNASGNRVPYSSKLQVSTAIEYSRPVGKHTVFSRVEYSYASDYFQTPENSLLVGDKIGANDFVNFRTGIRSRHFSFSAFAENIGGQRHAYAWSVNNYLSGYLAIVRPERFGIRVSVNY